MAKVGFIGTGEIAAAMVRGLAGEDHDIYLSSRNAGVAAALKAEVAGVSICDNQTVVDSSDIVWLCLMEDVARAILPDLIFRKDQAVLSAMVGVGLDELGSLCDPAHDISVTIPLPFVASGGCPLPVFPDSPSLTALFGERNLILPQDSEAAIGPHFAASALTSVVLAQLGEGAAWLGRETGRADAAEAYLTALIGGYLSSMPGDGQGHIARALDGLSTEGGLNATLRQHMANKGALDDLREGLDGFRARLGLRPKP